MSWCETAQTLRALDRKLLDWIKRMHLSGSQVYAACGGSLVLAEAGLLDGQQATTHWTYAPLFRQQFPRPTLHVERLLVQTGDGHSIVCAGGASSWQDLALLLVAKHGGTAEAIRMSKLFLYQWHRDGQLPYACMIQNVNHGDAIILQAARQWIAQNYDRPDVVAALVAQSGLPKRTFDRRFKAATGYSPLAYIQALAHRGSQADRWRPASLSKPSAARSATRTRPRSGGCFEGMPDSVRASIGASFSRRKLSAAAACTGGDLGPPDLRRRDQIHFAGSIALHAQRNRLRRCK